MISAKNIWQNTDAPLNVGLLVLNDSNMLSLAAAVDPMRACNRRADRVLFSWQFLAQGGQEVSLTSGMVLQTEDISGFIGDLLILVAGFGLEQHSTPALTIALRRCVVDGTHLWGVDGGSWVMAQAGLLDGHRATCHWEDAEAFARRFSAVNLVPDRYAISGPFATTGGASPCIFFILHLLTILHFLALSSRFSSSFFYDPLHSSYSPPHMISTTPLSPHHPLLSLILQHIYNFLYIPPSIQPLPPPLLFSKPPFLKQRRIQKKQFSLPIIYYSFINFLTPQTVI